MAKNPKQLLNYLSKRGPQRVLVGDLQFAGLSGSIFTPAEGRDLPAVAFGHGLLTSVKNYRRTLIHLASWGIVVAAPNTERGPLPRHTSLAADLASCLEIATQVRLGRGNITVHPQKLGTIGHGIGAGAALLAAAQNPELGATVALFPQDIAPSFRTFADKIAAHTLLIDGEYDSSPLTPTPITDALFEALPGDVVYRRVERGSRASFVEGQRVLKAAGIAPGPDRKTQKLTRALVTGYLLHQLAEDRTYAAFSDPETAIGKSAVRSAANIAATREGKGTGFSLRSLLAR